MALLICHECKNEVSSEASTCPKCGAKVKKPMGWVAKTVLILIATLIVLSMFASNQQKVNAVTSECVTNYKACKDNEDLINNYDSLAIIEARGRCKLSVNEHVKFGSPEWDWLYLTRFSDGNDYVKTGVIRIADYDVKIENEYGAKGHTKVVCSYDLDSKKVLDITIGGEPIIFSVKPTTDTSSVAAEPITSEVDKEQSDAKVESVTGVNPSSNESTEKIDSSANTQNNPAPTPQVASFDCAKAKSKSEILICNDPELSKLDSELALSYRDAQAKAADVDSFKKETLAAWKWRELNCRDKECLLQWYAERESVLQKVVHGDE